MACSTNYDIRPWTGRYVFQWDRLLDQGLVFVQAGVPSCSDDVTQRSCVNFKCDGFPLISGPSNVFLWNLINHGVITFYDISSSNNLYNSYFTKLLRHAVYNAWLTLVTARGLQSSACGIEMRRGKPWMYVNSISKETICSGKLIFFIEILFTSNKIE